MPESRSGSYWKVNASVPLKDGTIYLRAKFSAKGDKIKASEGGHDLLVKCNLSYSTDGKKFQPLGETFQVKEGKWIGAKVGIFCTRPAIVTNDGGWTDADWFRIENKENIHNTLYFCILIHESRISCRLNS